MVLAGVSRNLVTIFYLFFFFPFFAVEINALEEGRRSSPCSCFLSTATSCCHAAPPLFFFAHSGEPYLPFIAVLIDDSLPRFLPFPSLFFFLLKNNDQGRNQLFVFYVLFGHKFPMAISLFHLPFFFPFFPLGKLLFFSTKISAFSLFFASLLRIFRRDNVLPFFFPGSDRQLKICDKLASLFQFTLSPQCWSLRESPFSSPFSPFLLNRQRQRWTVAPPLPLLIIAWDFELVESKTHAADFPLLSPPLFFSLFHVLI